MKASPFPSPSFLRCLLVLQCIVGPVLAANSIQDVAEPRDHVARASKYPKKVAHSSDFTPDHVIRIKTQNITQACDTRLSMVVNNTVPAPAIRLQSGRSYYIRVYNDMNHHNLTMHWHGIAQYMAQFSDGNLATQWPIPPDAEVSVPAGSGGTFFYHAHNGVHALTVSGPLIVEDCANETPYHFDDERTFFWHDHFAAEDDTIEKLLAKTPYKWPGEVGALMLNGKGVATNHTPGDLSGDKSCGIPVIKVEPGKTYRFRNIGGTGLSHAMAQFEGHENFSIIAADGHYTKEAPTDKLSIGSGQRFDILFKAKTAKELKALGKTDFWIQWETKDRPTTYRGWGLLSYEVKGNGQLAQDYTLPAAPKFQMPNITNDWMEYALTPLYPEKAPKFPTAADVTRRIVITVVQLNTTVRGPSLIDWQLNGNSWFEQIQGDGTKTPLLIDIYKNGEGAMPDYDAAVKNGGWDPVTKVWPFKLNEVVEIVFQNTGSYYTPSPGGRDSHPMHLHGEPFFDCGSGPGEYDPDVAEKQLQEKYLNKGLIPALRDTTLLHRYEVKGKAGEKSGWRMWRINMTQPGVWMMHCHTAAHMVMGMNTVWTVGSAADIQKYPVDLDDDYFTYGGDVMGNSTWDPLQIEEFSHGDWAKYLQCLDADLDGFKVSP